MSGLRYAELQVTSHFSFLRGASSCEELFATAAVLGVEALAIVDRNSLAGIVRAHEAAKATGVRLVVGCRLDLSDETSVLVYPTDRPGYSRLCRLLSLGKKRAGKAKFDLAWADLVAYGDGLIAVLVPNEADEECALRLRRLCEAFGNRAYMALSLRRRPNDQLRLFELSNLATSMRVPTIVTNDVLFHEPGRRILQDVVTCIRHAVTIDKLGDRRERHADRYLKLPEEMHRLFARYPEALARTVEIVDRCRFSLDELAYQYPEERADPSLTPQETLDNLTWESAARRYPEGLPDDVIQTLRHELDLIEKLRYAPYFLTVHSIVRFARSKDILCQGRGSAANSAVCYVLGITSIDPARNDLLFERFVSEERHEPPDIDVDFEHERREIVMQWIFDQYGRDHAATKGYSIPIDPQSPFNAIGRGWIFGLPVPAIIAVVVLALGFLVFSETTFGRYVTGVGANEEAVRRAGVDTKRIKLAVYALSGFAAAIAGIIIAGRLGSGSSNAGGGFELEVIAAVVLGGTSLFGGRGTMLGTMLGALTVAVIGNGLILYHMSPFITPIVEGFIILIAVWLNFRLFRTGRRTN